MTYFSPRTYKQSSRHARIYAAFEIAYTVVDFCAAVAFIVGSYMFFHSQLQTEGTWCFLIGSILFAVKPSLRLARELRLAALGDPDDVAQHFQV